jgi:hypothetical protein
VNVVFVDATGGGVVTPAGATARSVADIVASGVAAEEALVIYAPAPGWQGEEELLAMLQRSMATAVVVRAERGDGFTEDRLAAACSGLIAGFGEAGIAEAVAALASR